MTKMAWEDLESIIKSFIESGAKRVDEETPYYKHKIYWVGDYIRIDSHIKTD